MKNFISQNKTILILILAYFLIFSFYSCLRHYTFQTQTWDLATFEQSFWNTIHGKFMFNNFEGTNHFAIHFSPFLLLLVPFYAIWPSPYNLLILQTLALALGALPLYLLARQILDKKWATIVAVLYLIYPSLHWVNLFDFHAVAFAIPLILTAFYFLQKQKYWWTSLFLILTASVAENMIVAVFFIGLYLLLFKNRKIGLAVTLISLIFFILVGQMIMPAFGGGIVRLDRYAQFGTTATEITTNVILKPGLTIQTVFTSAKMLYLLKIFLSVAFLPLMAGQTLVLLIPGLLQNLLTTFEFQFANFYQYDSILIPFIFIGVIFGLKKLLNRQYFSQKVLLTVIVVFALTSFIWNSPLSPVKFPLPKFTDKRIEDFRKILDLIPPDVSVAAYTNLVPHLTHREYIYMMGHEPFLVDYVIIDGEDIFGFPDQQTTDQYLDLYRQSGQYEMKIFDDRYYVLIRQNN